MELGQTHSYLHQYADNQRALKRAYEINPDNFWTKTALADASIRESGNVQTAMRLTAGAQHTDEIGFVESFLTARIFAREFDDALEAARNLTDEMEIQRQIIVLREDHAARILFFMGQQEEAISAARAGLFRLQALRQKFGDDYRIDLAEARLFALRGDSPDEIRAAIKKSSDSQPADAIEVFTTKYKHARIYAMAGMTADSIAGLEPLLSPPSNYSTPWVELDPAFDRIREDSEFVAMMERHQ